VTKAQLQVQEFHREVVGSPTSPATPQLRDSELRARLILEESFETVVALVGAKKAISLIKHELDSLPRTSSKPSLIETIDGLCDLWYVLLGTAETIGIDLEPFMDEVHRSNMLKKGAGVDKYGKQLKPKGWKPPDIAGVLCAYLAGIGPLMGQWPGEESDDEVFDALENDD